MHDTDVCGSNSFSDVAVRQLCIAFQQKPFQNATPD
jgi:hypothetical protein